MHLNTNANQQPKPKQFNPTQNQPQTPIDTNQPKLPWYHPFVHFSNIFQAKPKRGRMLYAGLGFLPLITGGLRALELPFPRRFWMSKSQKEKELRFWFLRFCNIIIRLVCFFGFYRFGWFLGFVSLVSLVALFFMAGFLGTWGICFSTQHFWGVGGNSWAAKGRNVSWNFRDSCNVSCGFFQGMMNAKRKYDRCSSSTGCSKRLRLCSLWIQKMCLSSNFYIFSRRLEKILMTSLLPCVWQWWAYHSKVCHAGGYPSYVGCLWFHRVAAAEDFRIICRELASKSKQ